MVVHGRASWTASKPDRFGNITLFNAGSAEAHQVRIEPETGADVTPRTFFQFHVPVSGTTEKLKVVRRGGVKYPSIRVMWKDKEGTPHSTTLEVQI